jgi:hypothetical protein
LLYKKQILEQEIKQRDTTLYKITDTLQNWHEENELKVKIQELIDFKEEITNDVKNESSVEGDIEQLDAEEGKTLSGEERKSEPEIRPIQGSLMDNSEMLSKMQLQLDKNKQVIRDLNTEIDGLKAKGQIDQNLISNKMKQISDLERKITNLEK